MLLNQGKRLLELESRVESIEGKRQSAPFAARAHKPVSTHKPSGSPKGHKGHFRAIPTVIDHESLLGGCPCCGGILIEVTTHEQYIEEIPKIRPEVSKIVTQSGYCSACKRRVRRHHPNQISQALGKANISLGIIAKELCLQLQYGLGMIRRKVVRVFKDYFAMSISVGGGIDQSAKKLTAPYEELLTSVAQSQHIHIDETSWYVGSNDWCLWVLTNKNQTLYQFRDTRARVVITDVIGKDYQGGIDK
jgi:transposase